MLRLQLQTMGSGALHCRTPPPARHRARYEGLTTGLSSLQTLGMRDNVAAREPILRALAPTLAGFPRTEGSGRLVLEEACPTKTRRRRNSSGVANQLSWSATPLGVPRPGEGVESRCLGIFASRATLTRLHRRARHGAIGAGHAAIAGQRLERLAAAFARVEEPASIGRHLLGRLVPAARTRQRGFDLHHSTTAGKSQACGSRVGEASYSPRSIYPTLLRSAPCR
jgi:hypothetical protein